MKEIRRQEAPDAQGPLVGPGGSAGSGLVVCRPHTWELFSESLSLPQEAVTSDQPLCWSLVWPRVCETAPGDNVSLPQLNFPYLLQQEKQMAVVGELQGSGSRCVALCPVLKAPAACPCLLCSSSPCRLGSCFYHSVLPSDLLVPSATSLPWSSSLLPSSVPCLISAFKALRLTSVTPAVVVLGGCSSSTSLYLLLLSVLSEYPSSGHPSSG